MQTITVPARDLQHGDRVTLGQPFFPRGIVRTVDYVTDSGYVNYRDVPILSVRYVEPADDQWRSTGNTWAASSPVTVEREVAA